MKKIVLGVKIDDISLIEAQRCVERWLLCKRRRRSRIIVTPNPEFLVTAQKDMEFKEILNGAALSLPDGYGLNIFAGITNRVPGVDFMLALFRKAEENNWTIGLAGGREGVAKMTASKLHKLYPNTSIRFAIDGGEVDRILGLGNLSDLGNLGHLKPVDLLFVALGHPKQEKLLAQLRQNNFKFKILNLKFRVGVGVGGAFDYISQKVPRAPAVLRRLGLEWLFRLLIEPRRAGRIFRAVIIFPFLIAKERLLSCTFYRRGN